jgi:hypothetical protein
VQKVEVIMIEQSDIEIVDKEYFEIIGKKPYTLTIRSRSTGHYWCLLEQVCNNHRTFRIGHKHKEIDPYHYQRNKPSVAACCEYIRSHDEYHIKKERKKKERRLIRRASMNMNKKDPVPR